MDILQQITMVGAVLAMLGGALWFLRRRGKWDGFRVRGDRKLAVIERLTLTPQHTICLVRVGDRTMLIGTSPSLCQVLDGVLPVPLSK